MKNKIVIFFKVAIIIAFSFLVFLGARYVNASITVSKSRTIQYNSSGYFYTSTSASALKKGELASYLQSHRNAIFSSNTDIESLVGSYISGSGGNYESYYTVGCLGERKSNGDYINRIQQALQFTIDDDGNYALYNYYISSNGTSNVTVSTQNITNLTTNYEALRKLAALAEYQMNTNKSASRGDSSIFAAISACWDAAMDYSSFCKSYGLTNYSSYTNTSQGGWTSKNGVKSYLTQESSYSKVTLSSEETETWASGKYTYIGPITVNFGGTEIDSITVSGYTGDVYWSESSDSGYKKSKSGIENGDKIYLRLETDLISEDGEVEITFTQDTGLYEVAYLIASPWRGYQILGFFTCSTQTMTQSSSIKVKLSYSIDITIDKLDADKLEEGVETGIEGIGFTIYDETVGKYIVTSSGSSSAGYTSGTGKYASSGTKESKAIVYTDEDGKINITDLSVSYGTHKITVTEVKSKNDYYTVDSSNTETKEITSTGEYSYSFTNEPLEVTISKVDSTTGTALQGIGFKLKLSDGTWVKGNGSGDVSYVSSSSKADEYVTGEDGTVTIVGLKKGTYTVYETSVDSNYTSGYYLEDQEGYDSKNGWVVCGTVEVKDSGDNTFSVEYENVRRLQLSGFVWVDESTNKSTDTDDGGYDNVYTDSEELTEQKINGVTVYLYNKNDTENYAAVTTTEPDKTYGDGYYIFGYECYNNSSYTGEKLTYENVEDFYVEFYYAELEIKETHEDDAETLSGTQFIPVAFNSDNIEETPIVYNGSRALMDEVAYEDEKLTGIATTYTGIENEATYGLSGNLFDALYNSDSNTLEWINLGLVPIYDPDYTLKEKLDYVKIVVNGYEYTYLYDDDDVEKVGSDDEITVPVVSYQADVQYYERYVYPSDMALAIISEREDVQVYVVYEIIIANTETYSVKNRYYEDKLYITSLKNTFDSSRYELDTESYSSDNEDFAKWTTSTDNDDGTSTTEYTGDINALGSEETDSVYIQFQVTLEGITEILANPNGVYEEFPTEASTIGYHTYTRKDYSWSNKIYKEDVEHQSSNKTKTSSAPYLVFKLPEDSDYPESTDVAYLSREISGVVFEDTDTSSEDDEALGNGQYDSDSESVVANVTVDLLDEDGNAVYKYAVYKDGEYYLYNRVYDDEGETYEENYYRYDESSGEYVIITDDNFSIESTLITATSDSSGSYTLSGMVPGEYTLKFTYEDTEEDSEGNLLKTKIVSSDGTEKAISINDYKSTIVTSTYASNAIKYEDAEEEVQENNSYTNEWYKYLEDDNYSVAVDDLQQREDYNEEYYEALYNDDKAVTTTIMEAYTAEFAITVENTTDTSNAGYTETEYIVGGEIQETQPTDGTKYIKITDSCYIVGGESKSEEPTDTTDYITVKYSFFAYEYSGFNFGIILQPVQSLDIDKVITNVKLVNDPTVLFDGNPQTGDLDGVSDLDGDDTNNASTYTRIEVEENEMYGSTFTVTYEITITNTSQINYYETDSDYYGWYYMFGEKDLNGDDTDGTADYSEIVYIDIETLLDYLDYDLTLSGSMYEIATDIDGNETTTELVIADENIAKTTITTERQNDEIDVTQYTISEQLTPLAREEEGSSDVVKLTATKVLSTSEDDMAYSNVGEIIKARNSDKDGNVSDTTSIKLVRAPVLPEKAEAYVTISPPTGGDASTILIYVIAGLGMLMVLSIGIVIIKKKIL